MGETITFKNFMYNSTLTVPLSLDSLKPSIDLYFLIDATFTNRALLREAQDSIPVLMQSVAALRADPAFGAGIFRDESELWDGFQNIATLTDRQSDVVAAVADAKGTGGLDYFESNLAALYQAARNDSVGWRRSARKFVIMAAAFVGHEPTCTGDLPRLDRAVVVDALVKDGIAPILYSAPDDVMDAATVPYGCKNANAAGKGQGSYVSEKASGAFIKGKAKELVVDDVLASVKELFYKVRVDLKDCEKDLNIRSDVPDSGIIPYGKNIELSFELSDSMCRKSTSGIVKGKCTVEFEIDGVRKQQVTIIVDQYEGCPDTYSPEHQVA